MTDEELNRLVLERAQQQVEARKHMSAQVGPSLPERNERPALWAFLGLLVTLTLATLLFLPGTFVDRLGWIVHGVCAQEHTLNIAGVEMPLCQRNTGIYSGFLATLLTLLVLGRGRAAQLPKLPILLLLVANIVWIGVAGFNSLLLDMGGFNFYEPQPILRVLSGLAMGMSVGTLLLYAFNIVVRAQPNYNERILHGWGDVALIAMVELALFALIQLNTPLLIYPLAIFSTIGIVGVMFAVNLIILAMIMRYDSLVTRIEQLARPAMIALVLTGIEFGLLAWGRVALEHSM